MFQIQLIEQRRPPPEGVKSWKKSNDKNSEVKCLPDNRASQKATESIRKIQDIYFLERRFFC